MEIYFLLLLIVILAGALGSGYPVAFALPGSAILTIGLAAGSGYLFAGDVSAFFHTGGPREWLTAGVTNLRGVYWEVERDTLISIPLFIFMGIMLQRSKIAEDLLVTMAQLFGPVPGGLGISVVFVGALLAATTGIVGATVVAMGMISLPAMLRNKYSVPLATGSIAASGTLGQIIPPSIVLIILTDQLGSAADQASTARKDLYKEATGELTMPSAFDVASTSAGEMFLGAFVPGLVLVGLYMLYILVYAQIKPSAAPATPYEGEKKDRAFWMKISLSLFAPLALILLVLGSIIGGIATVNQAGAIGASGALIMAGYKLPDAGRKTFVPAIIAFSGLAIIVFALLTFEMNLKSVLANDDDLSGIFIGVAGVTLVVVALIWSGLRVHRADGTLHQVVLETAKTTSLVFIILLGAAILTSAFRAFGGEDIVREFLNTLPGGFWTKFIIVMAVIFFLGFFLDFIEIAVVVVPIVAPILLADPSANITAVWLGVMIGLNMQTSFLTPPFGFALFYLRGVASKAVKTIQIYCGVLPFIGLQLVPLVIAGYAPEVVNYLPNRIQFTSETAPPPRNPKLEYCLTNYIDSRVAEDGQWIDSVIADAQGLDLSMLPKDMAKDLSRAFERAVETKAQIGVIKAASGAVDSAAGAYRSIQTLVRDLEADAQDHKEELHKLKTQLSRLGENDSGEAISDRIEASQAELNAILAKVPETWSETHETFQKFLTEDEKARRLYGRLSGQAFNEPAKLYAALNDNAAFARLENILSGLRSIVETSEDGEDAVKDVARQFADLEGPGDVKSLLYKTARALRAGKLDRERALKYYKQALSTYQYEMTWRHAAEAVLKPTILAYVEMMGETLSARHQSSLSKDQARFLASCNASHRDISLYF